MEGFGFDALWIVIGGCVVIALAIGFLVGFYIGGDKDKAVKEAQESHDAYREDVREHFEQTSQIMSRMVEDYRQMYEHMSAGAGKLADMHTERVITPPPAPEAITAKRQAEETEPAPLPDDAGTMDRDAADEQAEAQVEAVATARSVDDEQPADDADSATTAESPTQTQGQQAEGSAEVRESSGQADTGEQVAAPDDASDTAVQSSADGTADETDDEDSIAHEADKSRDDAESDKDRARRLSGEAPVRGEKSGGI